MTHDSTRFAPMGSKFIFLPQVPPHSTLGVGYLIEGTHAESALRPGLRT